MLNEMRLGSLSAESIMKFKALQRKPVYDDDLEPTELFPTRREVDDANNLRLHVLPGKTHTFHAEEGGAISNQQQRDRMLQNCMAAQTLELKVNAQVMLIKNMDESLVNGSLGKVIGFMTETIYSMCEHENVDVEDALHSDAAADPHGFKSLDDENEDSESVARKKKLIIKFQAMAA